MSRARQKVWFVYEESRRHRGSVTMRAHQLCALAREHLGDRCEFGLLRMPSSRLLHRIWVEARPRGGVYFLTKPSVQRLRASNALRLQAKADGVCFDHVDVDLRWIRTAGADIHLCSSYGQLRAMERLQRSEGLPGKPMLLLHNADAELYRLAFPGPPTFKPVFCGTERLGHLPGEIRARLDVLDARSVSRFQAVIGRLPDYNFHYCVRSDDAPRSQLYKPFTKGFTAAICRSNVLAHRDTCDAVEFLGADYPYLVDTFETETVLATLERAAAEFGTDPWRRALARMQSVAERVSPAALAGQIGLILKELGA